MSFYRPHSGPNAGRLVRRDAGEPSDAVASDGAPLRPDGMPAGTPGVPSSLLAGELDDGHARRIRGRDGAARQMKRESDQRGWGLSAEDCTRRVGQARDTASKRGG